MTWDWRDRSVTDQIVSWVRLPLQFVLIAIALAIAGPTDRRAPRDA